MERSKQPTNQNTYLNSRVPQYPNTRHSITGFCDRSVVDNFNKLETNFLEKYLRYIILDEFVPSHLNLTPDRHGVATSSVSSTTTTTVTTTSTVATSSSNTSRLQQPPFIFRVSSQFSLNSFTNDLSNKLAEHSDVAQNEILKSCFGKDRDILPFDYFFVSCFVKITNQKLKTLPEVIIDNLLHTLPSEIGCSIPPQNSNKEHSKSVLKRALSFFSGSQRNSTNLPSSVHQKAPEPQKVRVHILLLFNGDTNFSFEDYPSQYQDERTIDLGGSLEAHLFINVCYISKVALFQHFSKTNNYKIEAIDDKTITFYELSRLNFKQKRIAQQMAAQSSRSQTNIQQGSQQNVLTYLNLNQNLRQKLKDISSHKSFPVMLLSAGALTAIFIAKKLISSSKVSGS